MACGLSNAFPDLVWISVGNGLVVKDSLALGLMMNPIKTKEKVFLV